MNKVWIAFGVLLFVAACKEVGPPGFKLYVPPHVYTGDSAIIVATTDTSVPQKRMVLLEEMTGVRCTNCPKGQALAEKLADTTYPGQVAVVAVHGANFLTSPYNNEENYDNADNDAVDAFLGGSPAKPTAALDRFLDAGSGQRFYYTSSWESEVQTRLTTPAPVKIYFAKKYSADKRHLVVKVFVKYNKTVTNAQKLHIFLTESNLVCTQADGSSSTGKDLNYAHSNVLRKIMTLNGVNGDNITGTTSSGYVFSQVYTYDLPANINPDNCHLVAFVSGTPTDNTTVVQAQTTTLK